MDDASCNYRISVKAVIKDDDGRILLLRDESGSWELPGGGLEHGEEPREGLYREIYEETGMNVTLMNEFPAGFWSIKKEVGSPTLKWFAFIIYEAKVSGQFVPNPDSDESQEAKYFSIEEVEHLQLHDNTKPYFT